MPCTTSVWSRGDSIRRYSCVKVSDAYIRPIGLIRPIRQIRLIRPIRLMGGIGLMCLLSLDLRHKKNEQQARRLYCSFPLSTAVRTRLELATPCVTGMYSNQAELPHRLRVCISVSPDLRVQSYCVFFNYASFCLKKCLLYSQKLSFLSEYGRCRCFFEFFAKKIRFLSQLI